MDELRREPDEYIVNCFTCSNEFNALESTLCSCLVSSRSLVCPHCLQCFCKAPHEYKRAFWGSAPQSLWQKKLEEQGAGRKPAEALDPDDPQNHPLVLIVEDEPDVRRVAAMAVEGMGYQVLLAKDGLEGLSLARTYRPELVITDALLPKLDGREMGRRIKEEDPDEQTKVVIMTSIYTSAKYRAEAMRHFRADDYFCKPLEIKQLQSILLKYLE